MGNRDPFLTHLKKFGYSVVRLPRATVEPLQLVVKNGNRYRSIGKLTTVFSPGPSVPVPTITTNIPAANVNGHKSGNLKIGVGLNLLGHIISAMGGGTLGLQVAYQRARFTEFKFDDVLRDDAEVAKLDQFLSDADINPFSTGIDQMLEADRVCVTTSTLKSTKFTVISKEISGKGSGSAGTRNQGGSRRIGWNLCRFGIVSYHHLRRERASGLWLSRSPSFL